MLGATVGFNFIPVQPKGYFNGYGRSFYSDGYYIGMYKDGDRHGRGKRVVDEKVEDGFWDKGKFKEDVSDAINKLQQDKDLSDSEKDIF